MPSKKGRTPSTAPTLRTTADTMRYCRTTTSGAASTTTTTSNDDPPIQSNSISVNNKKPIPSLPSELRRKRIFAYDTQKYQLREEMTKMLSELDNDLIGTWKTQDNENITTTSAKQRQQSLVLPLEDFVVPATSLQTSRTKTFDGDRAQSVLSHGTARNASFLRVYDAFIQECVVPWLEHSVRQLSITDTDTEPAELPTQNTTTTTTSDSSKDSNGNNNTKEIAKPAKTITHSTKTPAPVQPQQPQVVFYYQRPPSVRIQPGPSERYVRPHNDADYGHQDGELNFWMPLTDPNMLQMQNDSGTATELWVESSPDKQDFAPLGVQLGQVACFHGTSCRHYVPANASSHTRVSLDFRIGIGNYFDPDWQMSGTLLHKARYIEVV